MFSVQRSAWLRSVQIIYGNGWMHFCFTLVLLLLFSLRTSTIWLQHLIPDTKVGSEVFYNFEYGPNWTRNKTGTRDETTSNTVSTGHCLDAGCRCTASTAMQWHAGESRNKLYSCDIQVPPAVPTFKSWAVSDARGHVPHCTFSCYSAECSSLLTAGALTEWDKIRGDGISLGG